MWGNMGKDTEKGVTTMLCQTKMALRRAATLAGALLTITTMGLPALAKPPAHAPAHGYRAKAERKAEKERIKQERKEDKEDRKRERERLRPERRADLDRDNIPDYRDSDIDGDGVSNRNDRYPRDARRR